MSDQKRISRRRLLGKAAALGAGLAFAGPILAACGPTPTPQIIKETVVVEKPVAQTVVVEKPVTKVIEKVVEKEITRIVAGTPVVMKEVVKETVVIEKQVPAAKEVKQLSYRVLGGGTEPDLLVEYVQRFDASRPDVEVKIDLEAGSWGEFTTKMGTLWMTHRGPDVTTAITSPSPLLWFAAKGWLRPLNDLIRAEGVDIEKIYFPAFLANSQWQGSQYGIPMVACPSVCTWLYNKDLWTAEKLPEPGPDTTWAQVTEAAQRLTKDTDKDGKVDQFGISPVIKSHGVMVLLRAFDANSMSPDGKKATIDSPQAMELWEWAYNCYRKWNVAPTPEQVVQSTGAMYIAGKLAMTQMGYWFQGTLRSVKAAPKPFASGIFPLPRSKTGKRATFPISGHYVISTTCKYPQEAYDMIRFTLNKEWGIRNGQIGACPGARMDVWDSPELNNDPEYGQFHKGFYEAVKGLTPAQVPHNLRLDEFFQGLYMGLDPLIVGTSTPDKLIPKLNQELQVVLDKPMA